MLRRVVEVLDADDALEHGVGRRVLRAVVDDARAVDQEHALGQRDVLPDFRLPGHGRDVADFFRAQRVDDRGLADVWVADKADRDVLLVRAQAGELPEQAQERPFAERVGDRGVEGQRRVVLGEHGEPLAGYPGGDLKSFLLFFLKLLGLR